MHEEQSGQRQYLRLETIFISPLLLNMNRINPTKLFNSKWTAVQPVDKQRHFIVISVIKSDDGLVTTCRIEAVLTHKVFDLDWRELKDSSRWVMGWK